MENRYAYRDRIKSAVMKPRKPPNKHQIRTEATHARLLKAAEEVFVRDGYEGAQLSAIAAAAGRTKGAVYDHFSSKEDLFLALFESRTKKYIDQLAELIKAREPGKDSLEAFRDFYVDLAKDNSWPILTLEFKLFALRHAESKDRLRKAFLMLKTSGAEDFTQKMFASLSHRQKSTAELSLSALGPIVSGLILESYFEPEILSEKHIRRLLTTVFDALFAAP
jgi:AcrR family transcriptional regulator